MTSVPQNIVLIGMPGVGKSTIGVLAAKALALKFIDTDLEMQDREGRALQEILDAEGILGFRAIEEQTLLELRAQNAVIATGGSAVYSDAGMNRLRQNGRIVWLDAPLEELRERLDNLPRRGVVMQRDQTLEGLFEERLPLYRKYADIVVECAGLDHESTLETMIELLSSKQIASGD